MCSTFIESLLEIKILDKLPCFKLVFNYSGDTSNGMV